MPNQSLEPTAGPGTICLFSVGEQSGKAVPPFSVVLQAFVHLTHLRAKFVPRNESFSAKEMFGHDFVPHNDTCEVLQCFSEFCFVHALIVRSESLL